MNYLLRAIDYKNMTIEFGNEVLSKLRFKNWGHSKAKLHFPKNDYIFDKDNWWGGRLKIIKNGLPIGIVKTNWKSHILIEIKEEYKKPLDFLMKRRGFFRPRFEVYLNDTHIITMQAKYNWFKANYEIELHQSKERIPYPVEELLGILAYGARFYRTQNSG